MLKRRSVQVILFISLLLLALGLLGPRVAVETTLAPVALAADLDQHITSHEAQFDDIVEGAEATIVWANADKSPTPYSIVYLHGFSASRQETAPLSDNVAQQLGANLYYPRLTGHGRDGDAMAEASVNDWLNDANEAVAIGRKLGNQVILIGVSTGATLATWIVNYSPQDVAAVVLISPNFAVNGGGTDLFLLPWGKQLLTAVMGEERAWEPENELQGRYWTERYPSEALLPMAGLVSIVDDLAHADQTVPTLFIYSPNDAVIDPDKVETVFAGWGAANKQLIPIENVGDPSNHVLAGDILSPDQTDSIAEMILEFIKTIE